MKEKLRIVFARRGYSPTGGAEAYLKRLAQGLAEAGRDVQLVATSDWPAADWAFGPITRLQAKSPLGFADELQKIQASFQRDILFSLERVWSCDVYRAGDGVHRAWLERKRQFELPLKQFVRSVSPKHRDLLRLEQSLFSDRNAGHVIAASQMVKDEIVNTYQYSPNKIDLIRTGIPLERFRFDPQLRERARQDLKLKPDHTALLFAGSGWKRKGLLFAVEAAALCRDPKTRLLVAGRGNPGPYKMKRLRFWRDEPVYFLGEVANMLSLYAAADIFILPTIYDPFSNACLEALACGLPVITTRSNGFSEIIEDGVHGSIVDHPGDFLALRDAIRFWSDSSRRLTARSAIIQHASKFDISKNIEETLAVLTRIASK